MYRKKKTTAEVRIVIYVYKNLVNMCLKTTEATETKLLDSNYIYIVYYRIFFFNIYVCSFAINFLRLSRALPFLSSYSPPIYLMNSFTNNITAYCVINSAFAKFLDKLY